MDNAMLTVVCAGFATILDNARQRASNAALEAIKQTLPWEKGDGVATVYHNTLSEAITPYVDAAMAFGRENGQSEVVEQYLDGLITKEELFSKIVFNVTFWVLAK